MNKKVEPLIEIKPRYVVGCDPALMDNRVKTMLYGTFVHNGERLEFINPTPDTKTGFFKPSYIDRLSMQTYIPHWADLLKQQKPIKEMKKFITPLSMEVSHKQYENDLKEPLEKLGYKVSELYNRKYIHTNWNNNSNDIRFGTITNKGFNGRYCINQYNPELFLALAAMTEGDEPIVGEYIVITEIKGYGWIKEEHLNRPIRVSRDKTTYRTGKFYGVAPGNLGASYGLYCPYRKATKEELIQYFTNKSKPMKEEIQYPITRAGFQRIHNVACGLWKERIKAMVNEYILPFENSGQIPYNHVKSMFDAAGMHNGVDQKEVLREVFPDFDKKLSLPVISGIQTVDRGSYLAWGDADIEKEILESMFNAGVTFFKVNQDGVKLTFSKDINDQLKDYIEQNPD